MSVDSSRIEGLARLPLKELRALLRYSGVNERGDKATLLARAIEGNLRADEPPEQNATMPAPRAARQTWSGYTPLLVTPGPGWRKLSLDDIERFVGKKAIKELPQYAEGSKDQQLYQRCGSHTDQLGDRRVSAAYLTHPPSLWMCGLTSKPTQSGGPLSRFGEHTLVFLPLHVIPSFQTRWHLRSPLLLSARVSAFCCLAFSLVRFCFLAQKSGQHDVLACGARADARAGSAAARGPWVHLAVVAFGHVHS